MKKLTCRRYRVYQASASPSGGGLEASSYSRNTRDARIQEGDDNSRVSRPWESLRTAATDVRLMCEQRWARQANCVLPEKFTILSKRARHLICFFRETDGIFPFEMSRKKFLKVGVEKTKLRIYSQTNPGFSIPYWRKRLFLDWNERVREQSFFKNDFGDVISFRSLSEPFRDFQRLLETFR